MITLFFLAIHSFYWLLTGDLLFQHFTQPNAPAYIFSMWLIEIHIEFCIAFAILTKGGK